MVERVIFRREYDKYDKRWKYLACFPDDKVNPGRIAATPFWWIGDEVWHEPYTEIDLDYFYKKPIIHKNTDEAARCLEAVKVMYEGTEFKICEKR